LGKRFTKEEKHLIQEFTQQGSTDESIAERLGRVRALDVCQPMYSMIYFLRG